MAVCHDIAGFLRTAADACFRCPAMHTGRLANRVACATPDHHNPGGESMSSAEHQHIVREIRAAYDHDPRVSPHQRNIHLDYHNGALIVSGEVSTIAAKRLAMSHARAVNGISRTRDALRVAPAERRGDGAVRDAVCEHLLGESALRDCGVIATANGQTTALRVTDAGAGGVISVDCADGAVTLTGRVGSLSHRRLAGALAWWAPGCRDVINELEVVPVENDTDHEIIDALRIVLEKDPLVRADQIHVGAQGGVIRLAGLAANSDQSRMVEWDAWSIDGVRDVINEITVAN